MPPPWEGGRGVGRIRRMVHRVILPRSHILIVIEGRHEP